MSEEDTRIAENRGEKAPKTEHFFLSLSPLHIIISGAGSDFFLEFRDVIRVPVCLGDVLVIGNRILVKLGPVLLLQLMMLLRQCC